MQALGVRAHGLVVGHAKAPVEKSAYSLTLFELSIVYQPSENTCLSSSIVRYVYAAFRNIMKTDYKV